MQLMELLAMISAFGVSSTSLLEALNQFPPMLGCLVFGSLLMAIISSCDICLFLRVAMVHAYVYLDLYNLNLNQLLLAIIVH